MWPYIWPEAFSVRLGTWSHWAATTRVVSVRVVFAIKADGGKTYPQNISIRSFAEITDGKPKTHLV